MMLIFEKENTGEKSKVERRQMIDSSRFGHVGFEVPEEGGCLWRRAGGKCEFESEVRSTARAEGGLGMNHMFGRAAAMNK